MKSDSLLDQHDCKMVMKSSLGTWGWLGGAVMEYAASLLFLLGGCPYCKTITTTVVASRPLFWHPQWSARCSNPSQNYPVTPDPGGSIYNALGSNGRCCHCFCWIFPVDTGFLFWPVPYTPRAGLKWFRKLYGLKVAVYSRRKQRHAPGRRKNLL